ncbi:MAG TPA: hypothetical protein VE093_15655 [Polyangiaceae bacterium]|jgi:hypothetical protein|nr:hypothetical protein [Polyangiaceae bacterium]
MKRPLALGIFALAVLARPSVAPASDPASNNAPADEEKPIDGDAIPAEKSKSPKAAEWLTAPRVKFARKGPAAATCRAQIVREWMRVRCEGQVFAVSLVGGSREGVAFWIGGTAAEPFGEVLTPVRRGDRRVFQFWSPGKDAAGMFVPKPMLVVQEQWVEGQKAPIVTAW